MSKKGLGKLIFGIGAGIGLGFLFAPKTGTETRKALKLKLDQLVEDIKQIDMEDVQTIVEEKVSEIKKELEALDQEKIEKIAKEKVEKIKKEIADLAIIAKEKATPVIEKTVEELRLTAVKATKEVLAKLETPKTTKTK